MNEFVVVDASLVLKWLIEEEDSEQADDLLQRWRDEGVQLIAPHLMVFEAVNALHQRVLSDHFTVQRAASIVDDLISSEITLHDDPPIHRRALELANLLGQRAAYDAHYLALAERRECDLWTADARFHRAAATVTDRVRLLREYTPS